MDNEALRNKVIEIDISLHEQKMTLTTLEETMSRMVSILEKLTRIEQENAITKVTLENHLTRIKNLEERNKWVHRTIIGVIIAVIGQFIISGYLDKKQYNKQDKIIIKRTKQDSKKDNLKDYL